jgi:hypothetical protein
VRGSRIQIFAVLLIAFVAMGAQCVAFCEARDSVQPPCHQTDSSCSHDQAAADGGVKVVLIALAPAPDAQTVLYVPSIAISPQPAADPPIPDTVVTTVLRI